MVFVIVDDNSGISSSTSSFAHPNFSPFFDKLTFGVWCSSIIYSSRWASVDENE